MKPDRRLEAHLIHCERVAEDRRRAGQWPWDDPEITEEDYILSQEAVDAVAELITVLQSIRRRTADRRSTAINHDHKNHVKTKGSSSENQRH